MSPALARLVTAAALLTCAATVPRALTGRAAAPLFIAARGGASPPGGPLGNALLLAMLTAERWP